MGKFIKELEVVNEDKLHRAIYGNVGKDGKEHGGLIEKYGAEDKIPDNELLAHYDKLGGLIRKDGARIETGSFWNIEKKQPREKAEITLLFRDLRGRTVKIKDGDSIPLEVKAAEKLAKEDRAALEKKNKKEEIEAKKEEKGKKKSADFEEEEEVLVDVNESQNEEE